MQIGKYKILKEFSSGGFSKIYLVEDILSNLYIAKEFVFNKYGKDSRFLLSYFKREAEFLKKNKGCLFIPEFFDFLKNENIYYIIQEYIQGVNLYDIVNFYYLNKLDFSLHQLRCILFFIVEFLNWFYRLSDNLIYRDLKPHNILYSITQQRLKFIDFGTIRSVSESLEVTIPLVSDGFSAPESYKTKYLDKTADFFSVAAIMYFLIFKEVYDYNYDKMDLSNIEDNFLKEVLYYNLSEDKQKRISIDYIYNQLKDENCEDFSLSVDFKDKLSLDNKFCINCYNKDFPLESLFCNRCGLPLFFAKLNLLEDNFLYKSFLLYIDRATTIGRQNTDIILQSEYVSRLHAQILFKDGAFYIKNLTKNNIVMINKERISYLQESKLKNLDIITIADLNFIFILKPVLKL